MLVFWGGKGGPSNVECLGLVGMTGLYNHLPYRFNNGVAVIIESQDSFGWKGPSKLVQSNPSEKYDEK